MTLHCNMMYAVQKGRWSEHCEGGWLHVHVMNDVVRAGLEMRRAVARCGLMPEVS